MNIGKRFYCSRCLHEISDECVCEKCSYDPSSEADPNAIEEGTTLYNHRFQIGAVRRKLKAGYVYGAYDFLRHRPVYIFEYFPELSLEHDKFSDSVLCVNHEHEAEFTEGKSKLLKRLRGRYEFFCENNTVYVFR